MDASDAKAPPPKATKRLTIVGIGASAGGLEALQALLGAVELDCLALIVVQHLSPEHKSQLAEILARATKLEVVTATEGLLVEANHVYVIPPNAELFLRDCRLHLRPPSSGVRLPVDAFFRSLAEDQGPTAIGVVLSGTGGDGTFGLKAIKAAGGIALAQDPLTAKYDGMPRHALDAGWVDFAMAPERIGHELTRLSRLPPLGQPHPKAPRLQDELAKILGLVRVAFGTDLSGYKPSTLERRLERRLALNKLERLEDYFVSARRTWGGRWTSSMPFWASRSGRSSPSSSIGSRR